MEEGGLSPIGIIVMILITLLAVVGYFAISRKSKDQTSQIPAKSTDNTNKSQVNNPLDNYTITPDIGIWGHDIGCFESVDAKVCMDKCSSDPNCRSFLSANAGDSRYFDGKGGCCYKYASLQPTSTPGTTFYVKKNQLDLMSKFDRLDDTDRPGADIQCLVDGSNVEVCAERCLGNPQCKAVNYLKPGDNRYWGGKGGCCYKTLADPLGPAPGITFYKRK
jgi:hypothetical protein